MILMSLSLALLFSCLLILTNTPMSMCMVLFFLSITVSMIMGLYISSWFGYMLFLIYVGGLLVMFIYICMISSNFMFLSRLYTWEMVFLSFMLMLLVFTSINFNKMTYLSAMLNGQILPITLFLLLGIYLLVCFLAIVNIIFSGGVILKLQLSEL